MFLPTTLFRIIFLVLMFCLAGLESKGQAHKFLIPVFADYEDDRGFILKADSSFHQGILYFNPAKPAEILYSAHRKEPPTTYTVDEITEFGFNEKATFLAKTVSLNGKPQQVFVEVISSDILYFKRDEIFLKTTPPRSL